MVAVGRLLVGSLRCPRFRSYSSIPAWCKGNQGPHNGSPQGDLAQMREGSAMVLFSHPDPLHRVLFR